MALISGSLFQGDAILLCFISRKERSPLTLSVWSVQLIFSIILTSAPQELKGGGLVGPDVLEPAC